MTRKALQHRRQPLRQQQDARHTADRELGAHAPRQDRVKHDHHDDGGTEQVHTVDVPLC